MFKINSDFAGLKYRFLSSTQEEYINNPLAFLKIKWEEFELNTINLVRVACGSTYLAIIQKYMNHNYGSMLVFSYGSVHPVYTRLVDGVWTDTSLTVTSDLGGAVFQPANGNIKYGMNGIYIGQFSNGPLQDNGESFSTCIYLIGTGSHQTAVYAFTVTQYTEGHLFFNRMSTNNTWDMPTWKKLIS